MALCFLNKSRFKLSSLGRAGAVAAVIPLSLIPQKAMAQATIVVSGVVDMHFGTMTETGAGGTMVLNTVGARTPTGSVSTITGAGLASQGEFSLSGSTGLAIDVSMSAAAFTVSNGAGDTMSINNFNLVTNAGGATRTITLAAATETFPMGATLNVSAGQASGDYLGNYTISANYQ